MIQAIFDESEDIFLSLWRSDDNFSIRWQSYERTTLDFPLDQNYARIH